MIEPARRPPSRGALSSQGDRVFQILILALASIIALIFLLSLYQLGRESLPALQRFGFRFLHRAHSGTRWRARTARPP